MTSNDLREIDRLVHRYVMGLQSPESAAEITPLYSTAMAMAWRVVLALCERHGFDFRLDGIIDGLWVVSVSRPGTEDAGFSIGTAPDAPLAICRVALSALGVKYG